MIVFIKEVIFGFADFVARRVALFPYERQSLGEFEHFEKASLSRTYKDTASKIEEYMIIRFGVEQ